MARKLEGNYITQIPVAATMQIQAGFEYTDAKFVYSASNSEIAIIRYDYN